MASPLRDLLAAAAGKLYKNDDSIFDLTTFLDTLATQLAGSGISVNTNELATSYEAKTFTLGAPAVDLDIKTTYAPDLFVTAHKNVRIKADGAFSFKLNSNTAPSIACSATEEFPITNFSVTNVFITCAAGVTIRIVAI